MRTAHLLKLQQEEYLNYSKTMSTGTTETTSIYTTVGVLNLETQICTEQTCKKHRATNLQNYRTKGRPQFQTCKTPDASKTTVLHRLAGVQKVYATSLQKVCIKCICYCC